jgi:hypothetical protein
MTLRSCCVLWSPSPVLGCRAVMCMEPWVILFLVVLCRLWPITYGTLYVAFVCIERGRFLAKWCGLLNTPCIAAAATAINSQKRCYSGSSGNHHALLAYPLTTSNGSFSAARASAAETLLVGDSCSIDSTGNGCMASR